MSAVKENRHRLKAKLNIHTLLSAKQTHGNAIFTTDTVLVEDTEVDEYDALMTNSSGIGLMIQQADCQAVTLFDPVNHAIAAIHCGWMGSVQNIISKTVLAMTTQYKSVASDLLATVSPSLGPCCAEFVNHATELPPFFLDFQVKENYFDFWTISQMQMESAGIHNKNITLARQCTSCSSDYFSYRRACREGTGQTGRFATVIILH